MIKMKKDTLKTIGIISILLLVIVVSAMYLGWPPLVTTEGSTISDCKFVVEGSVCDKYTECTYDDFGDRSCIKGYEIAGSDLPPPQLLEIPTINEGGSQ